MPLVVSRLVDLPLQSLSAHVARSFASLIGFAPMSPQLLKLMFTPDFGMFIAPGCDGLRGAITLGYIALIVGYLRSVSFWKWLLYVIGAVFLGYLFNLLRLCALVVYYRIAVGHPALEGVAKQADYGIGACMILVAAFFLFWIATRGEVSTSGTGKLPLSHAPPWKGEQRLNKWAVAAFVLVTLLFAIPSVRAAQSRLETLERIGGLTPQQLNDLMPKQLGEYKLNRAWQETSNGANLVESAAYSAPGSGEVVLGVWLLPMRHSVHGSWITRGERPELRANRDFMTAMGKVVSFDTAFYSDGVADSLVADAMCTSSSCLPSQLDDGIHMAFRSPRNFSMRGMRAVQIFFRVESLQSDLPKSAIHEALSAQAQRFLYNVDFAQFSKAFQ
jgi:exosortase J